MPVEVHEAEWAAVDTPEHLAARLWRGGRPTVLFQGDPSHAPSWVPRVAIDPVPVARVDGPSLPVARQALSRLQALVDGRRRAGGTADTGVAVLVSYDWGAHALLGEQPRRCDLPWIVAWRVDCAARFDAPGMPVLVRRSLRRAERPFRPPDLPAGPPDRTVPPPPARRVRTSLPRERYLRAVEELRRHIRLGNIYQGNLTQRFEIDTPGDPLEAYRRMVRATPAPRAAFVSTGDVSVASVSPEHFLLSTPEGTIETWPIKGTRRRGQTPEEDRALATDLLSSEKDRAELVMIVDLERNDLGRICRTGTVRVDPGIDLRSFPAVHHLVACVSGELLPDVGWLDLLAAAFPGGSVTGAPKRRAVRILQELEPVQRGYFTGSLFWLGDDGSLDSSILIRTATFTRERAWLGAGGGIVADSDPEREWQESNDKARAPAAALGFVPEQAE